MTNLSAVCGSTYEPLEALESNTVLQFCEKNREFSWWFYFQIFKYDTDLRDVNNHIL